MTRGAGPGTFELLARLPAQILALVRAEYENAKREITAKVKRAGIGLLAIIVALFFLFFAISAFVAAAIAGLAVVWPVWLSALVVGFGLILLAAAAILAGVALIKRGVPVPEQTIDRIEEDLNAFADVRFNQSAHAPRESPSGRMPQAGRRGTGDERYADRRRRGGCAARPRGTLRHAEPAARTSRLRAADR
ncbi:phage holin family protein [Leucobacter soli]|uniref:phage holin family protein n=1 Tax=Leucobacter soli TaxID=2812850 RepID=UPI003622C078